MTTGNPDLANWILVGSTFMTNTLPGQNKGYNFYLYRGRSDSRWMIRRMWGSLSIPVTSWKSIYHITKNLSAVIIRFRDMLEGITTRGFQHTAGWTRDQITNAKVTACAIRATAAMGSHPVNPDMEAPPTTSTVVEWKSLWSPGSADFLGWEGFDRHGRRVSSSFVDRDEDLTKPPTPQKERSLPPKPKRRIRL